MANKYQKMIMKWTRYWCKEWVEAGCLVSKEAGFKWVREQVRKHPHMRKKDE